MSDIKKLLQKIDTIGTPLMEDAALPKKFPGYLKGTDTAKDVENKMVGMEEGSAATLAGQTLAKKAASKIIPGVGTALSYKDAWDRLKKGDKVGAAMAGAAGTAFLVPGPGAVVGTALDAANIGRDIKAGEYDDLFKEEFLDKEKNKKHTDTVDEAILGDIFKKGAKFIKNLKGSPTPRSPSGTNRVDPSMFPPPAIRPGTAVTRQPTAVGRARDPNIIDVDAREIKPGLANTQKAALGAAAVGAAGGAGYMAGAAPSRPAAPAATASSPATAASAPAATASSPATPAASSSTDGRENEKPTQTGTIPTVTTNAEPERPFVAPPAGSGLRVPAGTSIPTRNFDTGGPALDNDFINRTTPKPQGFKFTPEQEAWLGGANRQDPYIINRMLKKVGGPQPPASYFKSDEDRGIAKNLGFSGEPIIPLRPEVSQLSRDEINRQITSPMSRSTDSSERVSSRGPSRGSYQWASSGSNMAENKHNIVNRLSRQFENYLDNRFDIIENNYIPKKKNLR